MADHIKLRGDTKAGWTATNPILEEREVGLELDTLEFKIGDGTQTWSQRPYWTGPSALRDKLSSLLGDARLDASAIKNLPIGASNTIQIAIQEGDTPYQAVKLLFPECNAMVNDNGVVTVDTSIQVVPVGQCWVAGAGNNEHTGSISKPFATIQHALNMGFGVVNILPGTYTENISIPVYYGLFGPSIEGFGVIEGPKAELRGTLTIPAGVSRVRIKTLQLDGKGVAPAIIDNGSEGRHTIDTCTVTGGAPGQDTITVTNGKNWWSVSQSSIEGIVTLSGTGTSASFNIFNSPNSYACLPKVAAGYTLTLSNVGKMGLITHTGGNVFADHVSSWYPVGGKVIDSSSVSPYDVIGVNYSVFSADAMTYGVISSVGATVIKNFNVESAYSDVCLSAVSTVTSTLITTTASALVAGTKKVERNVSYNATNGELTFTKSGSYSVSVMLKIDCSEWNKKVELWIEKYNTTTSAWDIVADTGFQQNFTTYQESSPHYNFASYFTSGEKYRLRAVSDTDTAIALKTITLINGVKMPAIRLSITF